MLAGCLLAAQFYTEVAPLCEHAHACFSPGMCSPDGMHASPQAFARQTPSPPLPRPAVLLLVQEDAGEVHCGAGRCVPHGRLHPPPAQVRGGACCGSRCASSWRVGAFEVVMRAWVVPGLCCTQARVIAG